MATAGPDGFPRISARTGQPVGLNVTFSRNGVPSDPFALRRVDIYHQSVKDDNLVAQVLFDTPDTTGYPSPAVIDPTRPGVFTTIFDIPDTFKE